MQCSDVVNVMSVVNKQAKPRSPPHVPNQRNDSLLLRGDDSGVATSADAPSCSGEYDDAEIR